MKTDSEIYMIIFAKIQRDGHWLAETYELDRESLFGTPENIFLNNKTNKITVTFNNGNTHTLHYGDDVEIFTRPKEKPKTDEKVSFSTTD